MTLSVNFPTFGRRGSRQSGLLCHYIVLLSRHDKSYGDAENTGIETQEWKCREDIADVEKARVELAEGDHRCGKR